MKRNSIEYLKLGHVNTWSSRNEVLHKLCIFETRSFQVRSSHPSSNFQSSNFSTIHHPRWTTYETWASWLRIFPIFCSYHFSVSGKLGLPWKLRQQSCSCLSRSLIWKTLIRLFFMEFLPLRLYISSWTNFYKTACVGCHESSDSQSSIKMNLTLNV